jgi:coatomer subunit zeta
MAPNMSLHSVIAVLVLSPDAVDPRLFAKYYSAPHTSNTSTEPRQPYASLKDQKAFEKGLLDKTAKQNSDVILYDNKVVVFKTEGDVMLFVVGGAEENEILLYNVVLALRDSLAILLKYPPFLRRALREVEEAVTNVITTQKLYRQAHCR